MMASAPRRGVAVTYALLVGEELCALALPALIGAAIDALTKGAYAGLAWLVGVLAVLIASGAGRRYYDTRLFGRWQMQLSTDLALNGAADGRMAQRAGNLRMIGDVTQFFEIQLPHAVAGVIASGGALVVLGFYDWRVAAAAAASVAVLAVLAGRFAVRTERLNCRLNDRVERENDVVLWGSARMVARHFDYVRRLRVARSDLETGLFALSWLVLTATIAGALLLVVRAGDSPGTIFAQMTYLLAFAESFALLPPTIERFTQVRDVLRRVRGLAAETKTGTSPASSVLPCGPTGRSRCTCASADQRC